MRWGVSSSLIQGEIMDLEKLRTRVEWSTRIAFSILSLVVLSYVGKFFFGSEGVLADETAVWGQFGDYIGGLLNPLIAFLAFYWLTQSVLLQKEELAETRKALRDSAAAQMKQERHAGRTAKINALSAMLSTYNGDLLRLREESRFVLEQIMSAGPYRSAVRMPGGEILPVNEAQDFVLRRERSIEIILGERARAMDSLRVLLE
jgi:hypothetical protein